MPVDNDVIKTKLDALNLKRDVLDKSVAEINTVLNQLTTIYERDIQERDPDNPRKLITVKRLDTDPGTGAAFTDARRQEVYDASIAEADRLLA